MDKNKWKFFASGICICILFCICISAVAERVRLKDSTERYHEFWEDPDEFDVWFLGTSHMYYGVQPMKLWKDYGMTAFNLGAPSSNMPQVYWTLKSALQYGKPKLVVLDLYRLKNDGIGEEYEKNVHLGMDEIPVSPEKVKGVIDIFRSNTKRVEYLWDFLIYHNRWDSLEKRDYEPEYSSLKGGRMKAKIEDVDSYVFPEEDAYSKKEVVGHKYLKKILDECEKQEVPILLISLPNCVNKKEQKCINRVKLIAKERNVPFLNMAYLKEDLINYRVDMADKGHMNPSGSEKITDYLGKYINENYDLKDWRSDEEVRAKWDRDYETYRAYKASSLQGEKNLQNYLLWMRDDRYTCYISKGKKSDFLKDARVPEVLDNASHLEWVSRKEMTGLLEKETIPKVSKKSVIIAVFDNESGKFADIAVFNGIKKRVIPK